MLTITLTFLVVLGFFSGLYLGRKSNKSIQNKIIELSDISNEISTSVDQVAMVSEEIVSASVEQLDALHSAVSASQQIRSMVERTTDNAKTLESDAGNLKAMVSSGSQVVNEMVISSNSIKETLSRFQLEMNERIEQLAKTLKIIQEIAAKTQVIDEIVFQTKLLSFNASVEAARAGEAGKGFGVVAEEVGKLAQMSGNSSREISDLVSRSVKVVDEAVKTTKKEVEVLTQQTASKGEEGLNIAKKCEELFKVMEDKINNTVQLIEQISSAAGEQSVGVAQVDDSIIRFQETTDKNRLVASQSTEHSREFKDQAGHLLGMVGEYFELFSVSNQRKKKYKKFIWSNKLVLNLANMDNEHQILVKKINHLIDELESRYDQSEQSKSMAAFKDLASYTIEHFSHEEKFLESMNYPQLKSHKKIHQKLLEQVTAFGQDLKSNNLDEMKFISFLRNWLISHIMGVDMQYSSFIHRDSNQRMSA